MTEFVVRSEWKIPARNFDVVVAGGGSSGMFAAIAAVQAEQKPPLSKARRESESYC